MFITPCFYCLFYHPCKQK